MPSQTPVSFRFPFDLDGKVDPEVVQAHRYAFQGILDLNNAVTSLKSQVEGLKTPTTAPQNNLAGVLAEVAGTKRFVSGFGYVNNQSAAHEYMTTVRDLGKLIVFKPAAPMVVTLDTGISPPWFSLITNLGTGDVMLVPLSGTINGNLSAIISTGGFALVFFDGANFWGVGTLT
jgi:hypothetical protein